MAGGDRHYQRVEPDWLGYQALADLRRLSQADIEQVVVEPSDLLGKGDLRQADLHLGLFLAALGEEGGQA
ncbi:hypothetical protein FQZ97_1276950 [compost metagenome]